MKFTFRNKNNGTFIHHNIERIISMEYHQINHEMPIGKAETPIQWIIQQNMSLYMLLHLYTHGNMSTQIFGQSG
jgi:hypothetical protein